MLIISANRPQSDWLSGYAPRSDHQGVARNREIADLLLSKVFDLQKSLIMRRPR